VPYRYSSYRIGQGDAILKHKREEGIALSWSTPPPLLFARCAI
jgi:hypothetical protein